MSAAAQSTTVSILLVEDDEAVRAVLSDLLTANGYAVLQAENGADGLQAVKAHVPDLILLDLNMPYMSGAAFRAVQRRLANNLSAIPVVVVSGDAAAADECAKLGAADYLAKPIEAATLLRTVRTHCAADAQP
jgi:CheY-like chemotaxis protein